MRLGIIQGRLSEWIVTYENFHNNPIFSEDVVNYPISSVCADFMVSDNFCDPTYLKNYLKPLCIAVSSNNIKNITIPLLENSNVDNKHIREKFINSIKPYTETYNNINFLIEAELHHQKLKDILEIGNNLFITYDTGNITSYGLCAEDYIYELCDRIKQVHIKDRTINPLKTVEPNTGDTDFKTIFKCLKEGGFDGIYTLQTARGVSGSEIKTIKRHKEIISKLYYG